MSNYCPDVLDEKCGTYIDALYQDRGIKSCSRVEDDYVALFNCAEDVGCEDLVELNCHLEEGMNWTDVPMTCTKLDCGSLLEAPGVSGDTLEIAIVTICSWWG